MNQRFIEPLRIKDSRCTQTKVCDAPHTFGGVKNAIPRH
jgi:hypothetical protein